MEWLLVIDLVSLHITILNLDFTQKDFFTIKILRTLLIILDFN